MSLSRPEGVAHCCARWHTYPRAIVFQLLVSCLFGDLRAGERKGPEAGVAADADTSYAGPVFVRLPK